MSDRDALARAEPSNNPWADQLGRSEPVVPTNLVLASVLDSVDAGLGRRPALTKASPRSPRRPPPLDGRPRSMTAAGPARSAGPVSPMLVSSRAEPGSSGRYSGPLFGTPPPWATSPPDGRADHHQRPVSHLLHTANVDDDAMQEPLTPSPAAAAVAVAADGPFESGIAAEFAREASRRHRNFADKEALATSDRERVQLFAEFIVEESRIRRGRYADAIDAMGSEILELTRDLFRPYPENRSPPPPPSPPSPSSSSSSSARNGRPSPQSLNSVVHGAFNASPSVGGRPDSAWWNGYMPSLSPIPSMSASIVPDELSSRGRAPSRWWEASQTGSAAGERSRGMERSKRESKYMGLPLRDWEDDSSSAANAAPGPSGQTVEYPPEKVGWHDQVTPRSSDPRKLDVSRLVTLPPPYPRHYPAVNNHHPDLAGLRTVVRGLTDMAAVIETKEAFASKRGELRAEAERRRQKRVDDVRHMVDSGRMSYADAAEVEQGERQRRIEALKAELDAFQAEVLKPLQGLLSQRIVAATCSFDELRGQLTDLNPVEEGDEKPELLEKLTLMKWLFEAREQLHRELHDLSGEADERYHSFVEAPYSDERKRREVQAFFDREERDRRAQSENHALARLELFVDVVESTVTKGVEVQLSTFWDIAPPLVEVIQRVNVDKGVQADAEYEFSQQYLWEVLGHAEKSAYQFIESQINLLCLLHEVKSGVTKQACKVMVAERRLAAAREGAREDEGARDGGGASGRRMWTGTGTGTGTGMGSTASGKRPRVAATFDGADKEARNGEGHGQDDDDADDDGNDDDMADTLRVEEERLTADLKEKVRTVEKQWHEAMGQVVEPLKLRIRDWLQQRGGWEVCEEDD